MRVDNNIQKKTEKTNNKDKSIIHNIIIADASGSMTGSKYDSSIKSIREELDLLSKDKNCTFLHTLVEFDSSRYKEHFFTSKEIGEFIAIGANGGTPLYNTIGIILTKLEKIVKPDERVLIKVFTDGQDTENGRGSWNSSSIAMYIKKLIDVNNWTITFNCTIQDKHYITRIGIPESNILTHNNTAEDIERVSQMRSINTVMYSSSVASGASAESLVSNFYSKSIDNEQ